MKQKEAVAIIVEAIVTSKETDKVLLLNEAERALAEYRFNTAKKDFEAMQSKPSSVVRTLYHSYLSELKYSYLKSKVKGIEGGKELINSISHVDGLPMVTSDVDGISHALFESSLLLSDKVDRLNKEKADLRKNKVKAPVKVKDLPASNELENLYKSMKGSVADIKERNRVLSQAKNKFENLHKSLKGSVAGIKERNRVLNKANQSLRDFNEELKKNSAYVTLLNKHLKTDNEYLKDEVELLKNKIEHNELPLLKPLIAKLKDELIAADKHILSLVIENRELRKSPVKRKRIVKNKT